MPLEMVQAYIYVPEIGTVAVAAGSVVLLYVDGAGPKFCDHTPVPTVGTLPPRLALVRPHGDWLAPVVAGVGLSQKFTVVFAVLGTQTPLEMVQV